MKDYKKISQDIINVVGEDNILNSFYCTTRLRLNLKDNDKLDVEKLKAVDGVVDVRMQQGQCQVIIGPDVDKLFDEFQKLCPNKTELSIEDRAEIEKENNKSESAFSKVTAFIAGIFIPVVPCLAGAGIIQAVLSICTYFGWMDSAGETYIILNVLQNAVFYFLPFLVAVGAAKQFKTNVYYAVVMAGIMLHPTITAAAGETYHLFGFIPVILADTSSTVIPIVLSVALLSVVDKWVNKVCPSSLRMMLASGVTFLVCGILSLVLFAPIGTVLGNWIGAGINWAMNVSSVLGGALLGGLHLVLVVTGTHFIEVPLIVQEMTSGAGTQIMPITAMGNTALFGSLLALIVKTKSAKKKADYTALEVPTMMGITEPVLYGVALVQRKPLVWSMVGGAVAGIIVAISGFKLTVLGVPGIFSGLLALFIMDQGFWFFVATIVAIAIGFIGTYLTYNPEEDK